MSSDQKPNNSPIWAPYTQMKHAPPPEMIDRGEGIWLYRKDGSKIMDAISSWWVNLHGHARPEIAEAIYAQALKLEQVISAGYSHEPAQELAKKVLAKSPDHLTKFFYSDNGSTAVEVGLKMAFQYWKNKGVQGRHRFLGLKGGYHGDTLGAMSVGDRSLFNDVFGELLFDADLIEAPYHYWGLEDIESQEAQSLAAVKKHLEDQGEDYAGFILEPLIQGAAGMKMYRCEFLSALTTLVQSYDIPVIYDEVMTGFGRTGSWFASIKAGTQPDIVCTSKGITGGTMPLAATLCTDKIYEAFLGDEDHLTLYHGHSYTANPLGCAAGLASLEIMEKESEANFQKLEEWHREELGKLVGHPRLSQLRVTGTIAAMEYKQVEGAKYNGRNEMIQAFLDEGIMLRPLGPSIYIIPPYCINREEIGQIYQTISKVLDA